ELKTYRYRGHSMSDPAKYRTKDEVAAYKEIDPIEVVKKTILSKKYMTQKQLDAMEEEVEKEVADSVEFADNSPFPDASEIYTDVYETEYPFIVD
ncbi:MAG: thiamine pyrophosphate-dependent enzyme, partial [Bacteroidia bacterium]